MLGSRHVAAGALPFIAGLLLVFAGPAIAGLTVQIVQPVNDPFTAVVESYVPFEAVAFADGEELPYGEVTWDWDFGDASPHSSANPTSHAFANAGSYTVTVAATLGALQAQAQIEGVLQVIPEPDYTGYWWLCLPSLSGSVDDPKTVDGGGILDYQVRCGDADTRQRWVNGLLMETLTVGDDSRGYECLIQTCLEEDYEISLHGVENNTTTWQFSGTLKGATADEDTDLLDEWLFNDAPGAVEGGTRDDTSVGPCQQVVHMKAPLGWLTVRVTRNGAGVPSRNCELWRNDNLHRSGATDGNGVWEIRQLAAGGYEARTADAEPAAVQVVKGQQADVEIQLP
jgi:hypothetical protein